MGISIHKNKAAIYVRVSTQWQIDKDSLQVQKRELIAYCELVLGIKDYFIFEDPGYSGKNTDRPAYQEMMRRLRTGEFSHLVVWKIDRISRNLVDFAMMHTELKELGVTFVSKNEQLDTSTAMGEAMQKIILVFAELERNITSERVTATMLSRASVGKWNGGRVPYGYSYDKKTDTFSFVEHECKVFNKIVELYEENLSVLYVARWLNENGLTTRAGKAWSTNSVYKLLTSDWYIGTYRYNVHKDGAGGKQNPEEEWIIIPNHHAPLISEQRYERIQFLLKRNRRGGVAEGKSYTKKNIHLFAGMVRCGSCGANMSATLDRRRADGWRPSIYGCATRRKDSKSCQNKYISDIILGPFIFNFLANLIRTQKTVTARTTLSSLEKKLLHGEAFYNTQITQDSLSAIRDLLASGSTGMEYRPASVFSGSDDTINEKDMLEDRRRKTELALNRLKALYLYSEDSMPEKDFIIERTKLMNTLEETNLRLAELKEETGESLTADEDFMRKASYFIMVEKLLDEKYIDYEKYIRSIEPSVPRAFIQTVLKSVSVENGEVVAIVFANGLIVEFTHE